MINLFSACLFCILSRLSWQRRMHRSNETPYSQSTTTHPTPCSTIQQFIFQWMLNPPIACTLLKITWLDPYDSVRQDGDTPLSVFWRIMTLFHPFFSKLVQLGKVKLIGSKNVSLAKVSMSAYCGINDFISFQCQINAEPHGLDRVPI